MSAPRVPLMLRFSPARVTPAGGAAPFASHVLELAPDGARMLLELPDPRSHGVVHTGQAVSVEVDDGVRLWQFDTRVLERLPRPEDGFWVARPADPAAYRSAQQRESLRGKLRCAVQLSVPDGAAAVPVRGESLDLGGGGARVRTPSALPVGVVVRLRVALLADRAPIVANARVVASAPDPANPVDSGAPATHTSRLEFQDLAEADRAEILQQCFRWQIEHRQKQQLRLE